MSLHGHNYGQLCSLLRMGFHSYNTGQTGAFGIVYKAHYSRHEGSAVETVAVKSLKGNVGSQSI